MQQDTLLKQFKGGKPFLAHNFRGSRSVTVRKAVPSIDRGVWQRLTHKAAADRKKTRQGETRDQYNTQRPELVIYFCQVPQPSKQKQTHKHHKLGTEPSEPVENIPDPNHNIWPLPSKGSVI